jgi:penicillin-binding protein-related factor A (putative recombinase)
MGYEINVSKNGKHYFATHERSLPYTKEAEEAFKDFKVRFPEEEGFNVTITYRPRTQYGCHLDEGGNLINHYLKSK